MVSIIVINYNTFNITCNCIDSIITHTKDVQYEIILVDNASTERNPDDFLEFFPTIKLLKSAVNGGFAKGNNLGIQHASGELILLLNSDTWLIEDSVSIAANYVKKSPEIGPLTVRLVYPNGKLQYMVRKFRSIQNEILDLFRLMLYLLPYKKRAALMLNQYFKGDFSTYCDWISGAFMLFRKDLINMLPDKKLDERFFMYGEDQLWCYQFLRAGYPSFFLADTTVIHIFNGSTPAKKQISLLYQRIDRELEIMAIRKGKSFYYYLFSIIYTTKIHIANLLHALIFKLKK